MSDIILIQGSLNPESKTAVLLDAVTKVLGEKKIGYETIDLRKLNLEFCVGMILKMEKLPMKKFL